MFRKINGHGSDYAIRPTGYLTFHRIDTTVMKSPSVGVPARYFGYLLVFAVLVFVGYGSVEVMNDETALQRALLLFQTDVETGLVQPAAGPETVLPERSGMR
ncbi:MAG: hypothetical protein ACE5Q3_07510 [Alphaproteobacteria bacterium]